MWRASLTAALDPMASDLLVTIRPRRTVAPVRT
jgi:hypothetical protein